MKGEYFMMKNHGLRRFFSLLLAVFMVCTLLPTAALAEDTTGADETQSKTVVEEQQDVPPVEDGKKEDEAVTPDGENDVQPESDLNSDANQPVVVFARDSSGITISASCIGALFLSGSTGEHTVKDITRTVYITRDDIGSKNAKGSAVARFTGSNEAGWTLVIDLEIGNYKGSIPTNARITNKDMSKATGRVTFGVTAGKDVATHITIMGASSLPDPAPDKPSDTAVKDLLNGDAVKVHCSTPNSGHTDATYPLKDSSFTVGDVQGSSGNYTCVVTVQAAQYVTAYGNGHTLAGANESPKTITLKHDGTKWTVQTVTPIVFNVVCNTAPAQPTAPSDNDVKALLGENAVQIICTNTQIGHGSKTFGLIDGTFTVYHNKNNCEVVINYFSPYVDAFNAAVNVPAGTHIADNSKTSQNQAKINLVWSDGKWTAADAPAKHHVLCSLQPAKPTAPSHDDLSNLIGEITVNCTNDAATHTPKSKGYTLIADSYTPGKVEGSADTGYTFTVTVNAEKYVTQFDTDTNATHTPRDGSKVVTLKYENDAWTVKEGKPVSFDVACVAQPTFDELKEIFNQKIFVECNTKPAHAMARYDLIAGSYTIEDFSTMTDLPTCTVVLNSRKYVASYNNTTNAVHTPENEVRRVALILRDGGWGVANDDDLPVVFQVVCVPDAPTDRYLEDLLNEKVKVACINGVHATLVCDLIDGSYQGSGVQPDGNGGYTYTVTIAAAEYVKKYNASWPHSLVKDEPTEKPVTLVWDADDSEWGFADASAVPVIFNVECLYTVTYEDGVNGSVFKAVSFLNLKKGEATPTIDDPIRVGYKFAGWEPTVAATVTKDETYIAQWEEVDTTFTVKYNDNVKGKAFKEQVYEDLKYNEETPDFNGKPERSGYTFTGWKPVVADRVTKDVVYYAQWKSNSGKDRVPKTGDGQIVMILGSVLLFSFCGATAVCLYDRKRKQG